jgi:hypothetical protein
VSIFIFFAKSHYTCSGLLKKVLIKKRISNSYNTNHSSGKPQITKHRKKTMEEADEMIVSEVFSEDFCMYYYKLNRET